MKFTMTTVLDGEDIADVLRWSVDGDESQLPVDKHAAEKVIVGLLSAYGTVGAVGEGGESDMYHYWPNAWTETNEATLRRDIAQWFGYSDLPTDCDYRLNGFEDEVYHVDFDVVRHHLTDGS